MIENETISVLIPFDTESKGLADHLRSGKRNRNLMRRAGGYQVSIYQRDFERLEAAGALEYAKIYQDRILMEDKKVAIIINIETWFDPQTGLIVPDSGIGLFM